MTQPRYVHGTEGPEQDRLLRFNALNNEGFLRSPHVNDTACVIADVQMPGMSGVELQSLLGSFVPMIFITAYPEDSIRSRAMKAGAICFLSKPFDGLRMIECIRTALKRHDDDDGNCRT